MLNTPFSLILCFGFSLALVPSARAADPSCTRSVSAELTASVQRPASSGRKGSCQDSLKAEQERQLSEAKLECLMDGFEDVTDLKVSCTKIVMRTKARKSYELRFESRWQCVRSSCP
jgi:hypothetical protein